MQTKLKVLLLAVGVLVFISCVHDRSGGDRWQLTTEAIQRFGELRDAGKLPGLGHDEHGELQTDTIPERQKVSFPVSVVLHITKEDKSRYDYTFAKENRSSGWRLTSVQRILADGQSEDLKLE